MARALVLAVTLVFYIIAFGLALAAIEKRSKVRFSFRELIHLLILPALQFLIENQAMISGS